MIELRPEVLRVGLGWALSWTNGPVLCTLSPSAVRLTAVNEQRFVASWEWQGRTRSDFRFFLIPPFVASTLAGPPAWELHRIKVQSDSQNVAMILEDRRQAYSLRWNWNPATFEAPPVFQQMARMPQDVIQTDYLTIADSAHLAIAKLGRISMMEDVTQDQLAILINFEPGRLSIDGQKIVEGDPHRYYFDPRLVIRGLEVVRGRSIGFSVTKTGKRAIFYLCTERENWQIHCSILSLSSGEVGANRDTRRRRSPLSDSKLLQVVRRSSLG
jgi:hypothetical protein